MIKGPKNWYDGPLDTGAMRTASGLDLSALPKNPRATQQHTGGTTDEYREYMRLYMRMRRQAAREGVAASAAA